MMGGGAYGFPESLTPYTDQALRNLQEARHVGAIPEQQLHAVLEERILRVAEAAGIERGKLAQALGQTGMWLCPARP